MWRQASKLTIAPGRLQWLRRLSLPRRLCIPAALKRDNDREQFAKNKAPYQTSIVEPALSFIGGFAPQLEKISPFFVADARPTRGSLFRIYRDTRFSPYERPFKTHVGIHFSHAGGKDAHAPVFYLHLEPDNYFVAAGIWHTDIRALTKVRTAIARLGAAGQSSEEANA